MFVGQVVECIRDEETEEARAHLSAVYNAFALQGVAMHREMARMKEHISGFETEQAEWRSAAETERKRFYALTDRLDTVKLAREEKEKDLDECRQMLRVELRSRMHLSTCRHCESSVFRVKEPALCVACEMEDLRALIKRRWVIVIETLRYRGGLEAVAHEHEKPRLSPQEAWHGISPFYRSVPEVIVFAEDIWMTEAEISRWE
jgi:hypothetical protein